MRAGQILKDFETDYVLREQQMIQKQMEDESKNESSMMSKLSKKISHSPSMGDRSSVSSEISVAVCIGKNQRRTKELLGIALTKYDSGVGNMIAHPSAYIPANCSIESSYIESSYKDYDSGQSYAILCYHIYIILP